MLRHLLHESAILVDVKESDYDEAVQHLSHQVPELNACTLSSSFILPVRNSVSLSVHYAKNLMAPQMALMVSRWGMQLPSGPMTTLLFLLFIPESGQMIDIQTSIKREIEKIVCDRFILERIKIAESSEEVLEVLLREHGISREVASAS